MVIFYPKEFALYFTTKVQYFDLNIFKGTTTASACNFYLLKTVKKSEHNGHLSVLQTKQITQIQKTDKKWQTISGKIDSSEDIFHISFNIAGEIAKA